MGKSWRRHPAAVWWPEENKEKMGGQHNTKKGFDQGEVRTMFSVQEGDTDDQWV